MYLYYLSLYILWICTSLTITLYIDWRTAVSRYSKYWWKKGKKKN